MRKIAVIARFTVVEALRARLPWIMVILLAVLILASLFVQHIAVIEGARIQSGFFAAAARFAAVLIISLHVAASVSREFHDKGTELLLALDLPRAGYYLGKLAGFCLIAVVMALLIVMTLGWLAGSHGLGGWGFSLGCELMLMVALTLFCAISFHQILPAVSFALAFYLAARGISAIQLMASARLHSADGWLQSVLGWMTDLLALLLPRLDQFTVTTWVVDQPAGFAHLTQVALQTVIYVALLACASLFDLYRRDF